jgi:outer membrane autotransporter protein
VFYSTGGVVDDHEYGNDYPQGGQGGGGADLPYASPDTPYAAPAAHHRSALWGRMTGTWANQDSSFTTGGLTFDTSFAQHDYGLLAGIEMRPPTDNSGWRLGLFGGWASSGLTFSSYGASVNYNGGTIGAYAGYIRGPLHMDAEFKADFLGVGYSSPSVSLSTNATNVGIMANAAWRTQKGNLYYEPIVSFDFVNTSLGKASGGGASISYSNGQSIRAGIGGRIGTSLGQPGGKKVDLDLMAKLWDEFGSPNTVTVSNGINTQSFSDSISGLYGEVSGRATVYSADRMWSGFAEASGKFSSKVTSVSAKVGVRRNF